MRVQVNDFRNALRIYQRNVQVDEYNLQSLVQLNAPIVLCESTGSKSAPFDKLGLDKELLLAVGARVMLTLASSMAPWAPSLASPGRRIRRIVSSAPGHILSTYFSTDIPAINDTVSLSRANLNLTGLGTTEENHLNWQESP